MTHEDKIIEEFKMFVPEDDGSATDWMKNTLTTYRAQVLEEERKKEWRYNALAD